MTRIRTGRKQKSTERVYPAVRRRLHPGRKKNKPGRYNEPEETVGGGSKGKGTKVNGLERALSSPDAASEVRKSVH